LGQDCRKKETLKPINAGAPTLRENDIKVSNKESKLGKTRQVDGETQEEGRWLVGNGGKKRLREKKSGH